MRYQNNQVIHLTRGEFKELKKKIYEECMNELLKRNQDILLATAEDSLYINLLTGTAALIDEFGYGEKRLFRYANAVANIQDGVNDGTITLEELEEKAARKGITFKKDT